MWPTCIRLLPESRGSAAEEVAADEAQLRAVESGGQAPSLRFWEAPEYAVVLGRSNQSDIEVNVAACEAENIPILRRCSGGGTVVVGPGCLCFSLVLPIGERHRQAGITAVTSSIMQRFAEGLSTSTESVTVRGVSDLTLDERKFSGNSERWMRHTLLHHGTILYDFELERIARWLKFPSKQPDYRDSRGHEAFIRNLERPRSIVMQQVAAAWNALCEAHG